VKYLLHFWTVLRHKWFVMIAGRKTGAPLLRLLLHDLSKLGPYEIDAYADKFHSARSEPGINRRFAFAWLHHQNSNAHHWEYWINRSGHSQPGLFDIDGAFEMPEWAVREMVADWMAAGRAYDGEWPQANGWKWLWKNYPQMILHFETDNKLSVILHQVDDRIKLFGSWKSLENLQILP